jgi:hypothetical protein
MNATAAPASHEYRFHTAWRVRATPELVTEILTSAKELPRWWPQVYLSVAEEPDGGFSLHTRGWLPYTLHWKFRVISTSHPHGFSLSAWGDLEGSGVWTFGPDGDYTDIPYEWRVLAKKPLLRRFSFLLKPLFSANHRWAMARGEEGLRVEIARRLASVPYR